MNDATAPLDLGALFAALSSRSVGYVVIGGVATQVHGHPRTTRDLDVIPDPDRTNLGRLAALLGEIGAVPIDVPGGPSPTLEQLTSAPVVPPLRTSAGELHVLNVVPGARPYAALRADALNIDLDGTEVPVVSLADLLAMKRATGRRRDLDDVAELERHNRPSAPRP